MQHTDPLIANPPEKSEGPFTTVVRRTIKKGKEQAFEDWLRGIMRDAMNFEGHLGAGIIRPSKRSRPEYVIVFHFDTYEHLIAWETSEIRRGWVLLVQPLITGETSVQRMTGLEYWFTVPEHPGISPPPRYKMAVVTWLALFPLVIVVPPFIVYFLAAVPWWVQIMVVAAIMVLVMTYVVMPLMTRIFSFWLYRRDL
jgi:hypothetical protein